MGWECSPHIRLGGGYSSLSCKYGYLCACKRGDSNPPCESFVPITIDTYIIMEVQTHQVGGRLLAEILSDQVILGTVEDALDLIGNMSYQGFDGVMVYEHNVPPEFFVLRNRLAGEILQKFAQYALPLTLIGDFGPYASPSLRDFIRESNARGQIRFVSTLEEALR